MTKIDFSLSPRQIVSLSRMAIACAVFFGVGCLQAAMHPSAGRPLHMLAQTGAAALIAAFAAALAVAGYAAYADIDRPRAHPGRRR